MGLRRAGWSWSSRKKIPSPRRVGAGGDDGGGIGALRVRVAPKLRHEGGGSRSVVPHDHPDPVHVFANIGVDPWDSFLPTRIHGSPGHQTLKDSSAY